MLHLAAAHHDFGIDEETYFSVNEGGARAVCAVMDEMGIRRVCFYSTVAVYGSRVAEPDEDTPCAPESPYGASKLAGEEVFEEWAGQGDGRTVLIIRPTVTFGPGNFANMYTLIRQIASRLYVSVGPGANRKSLVYVDNIVESTLALWERADAPTFDVFNAVDKPDLTSREIADVVCSALGRRPPRLRVPLAVALAGALPFDAVIAATGWNLPISSARVRKFAESNTVFSGAKISAVRPGRVALEEGIRRMVAWFQEDGRFLPVDRSIPPRELQPMSRATTEPERRSRSGVGRPATDQ